MCISVNVSLIACLFSVNSVTFMLIYNGKYLQK